MITSYYTKAISEEVTKALHEVDFPFPIADMGFATPQIVEMPVDYASVLDWFINNDVFINIYKEHSNFRASIKNKTTSINVADLGFLKTLDQLIILAVEFLKSKKDDNV